ncbi:hypothetical protein F5Y17DRAFT_265381 [Xylariaceae sp. FL0594]|nr:hypothetical protein F5Y17DRAFT_265381 [Xylariaceae sp. FL0594]
MPTTRSGAKGGVREVVGSKHQIDDKASPESKRPKKDEEPEDKSNEDRIPSPTEAYGSGYVPTKPKEESHADASDTNEVQKQSKDTGGAEQPDAREGTVPSSILEKGLVYFFFRGRVETDEPSNIEEIQRSYMILRPLGKDASIGEGTIQDAGNTRLVAVPKKVFPRSGRDRWIAFVEKSHASFATLKEEFLSSSEYETKTKGTRHTPAATPAAEGVYAITTTGRETHLAYMITLPSELGEVQKDLGLKEKGSFIISTRNPKYDAPRGTSLPKSPEYPKEVQDEFHDRRWLPSKPHHLDYVSTQFLLVGESSGIEKAVEPQKKDEEEGKDKPVEELEKLEDEDTHRMEDLKGDDSEAIFADLHARAKDYPKLPTTF